MVKHVSGVSSDVLQRPLTVERPSSREMIVPHASESTRGHRVGHGEREGMSCVGTGVMHFERIAEVMSFYQNVLEFKIRDYWLRPFPAYFFHVNPRHPSIAVVESGNNMIHHMMVELYSFDDVGQGYD